MLPNNDTRTLVRNAGALFSAQAIGLIVPLVTIPFLARVLQPQGWAPLLVAQALANWLVLLLEFGFDLSATRAVARARNDPPALPGVVAGVQGAKLLLIPLAAVILVISFSLVPDLRRHPEFLAWTLGYAVFRGLNPFWYFQGVERMRLAITVDTTCKAVAALGVFVVIRDPADGWRVLALQAVFAAIASAVLTHRMSAEVGVPRLRFKDALASLRGAVHVFALRGSSGLYVQANLLILSTLATPAAVAFFGGAERIIRAAINLMHPLTQALFPRISFLHAGEAQRAEQLVRRSLLGVGTFGVSLGLGASLAAPLLVRLILGPGYESAVPILRVLALLPPLIAVNTVLGLYWAVPFGRERAFLLGILAAGAVDVALAVLLVPRWGPSGMAIALVAAEAILLAWMAALYRARRQ